MQPLSELLPKPLLPIDGKPVIYHTLQTMIDLDFESTGIVIQEEYYEYFNKFVKMYFPDEEIDFFYQDQLSGIITAIQSADKYRNKRILACAGDTKFNKSHLDKFLKQQDEADILIGITKRPVEQLIRRSVIEINSDFDVLATIEKPRREQIKSEWSGVPIWMFNDNIWKLFPLTRRSNNGEYAVEGAIDLALEDDLDVKSIEINDTIDITTPNDVLFHNFDYINKLV